MARWPHYGGILIRKCMSWEFRRDKKVAVWPGESVRRGSTRGIEKSDLAANNKIILKSESVIFKWHRILLFILLDLITRLGFGEKILNEYSVTLGGPREDRGYLPCQYGPLLNRLFEKESCNRSIYFSYQRIYKAFLFNKIRLFFLRRDDFCSTNYQTSTCNVYSQQVSWASVSNTV